MNRPLDVTRASSLRVLRAGGRPIYWGPSGVGKTAFVESLARSEGRALTTLLGSQADPTDMGYPVVVPGMEVTDAFGIKHPVVKVAPAEDFVRLNDGRLHLLYLDELTRVPGNVMNTWLHLLHGGRAGRYQLDLAKVVICCAANPPDECTNGTELDEATMARLDHYYFRATEAAALEWAADFIGYWGDPELGWPRAHRPAGLTDAHLLKAQAFFAGLIKRVPDLWHARMERAGAAEPPKYKGADPTVPFPVPRGWDMCHRYVALALSAGLPVPAALPEIEARVGPAAALEVTAYATTADLPDPEAVLAAPDTWAFSGRVDVDLTVLLAVAAAVTARPTADRLCAAFEICHRSVADRSGAAAKEAAMAAVLRLGKLTQKGNPGYEAIVGALAAPERTAFYARLARAAAPFAKYVQLAKGGAP